MKDYKLNRTNRSTIHALLNSLYNNTMYELMYALIKLL